MSLGVYLERFEESAFSDYPEIYLEENGEKSTFDQAMREEIARSAISSEHAIVRGRSDPFASDGIVEIRSYSSDLLERYVELAQSLMPNDPSVREPGFARRLEEWLAKGRRKSFSVHIASSGDFAGACYVHDALAEPWEIGYDILPELRNRGYATRAARLLVEGCARRHGKRSFTARVDARNEASLAVMRKLGAKPVSVYRPPFVTVESLNLFDSMEADDAAVAELACKLGVPPGRLRICPVLFEILL